MVKKKKDKKKALKANNKRPASLHLPTLVPSVWVSLLWIENFNLMLTSQIFMADWKTDTKNENYVYHK